MPICLIALGSNVDALDAVFYNALRELERHGASTRTLSPIVTTRPVGAQAGSPFLNAAATVTSELSPIELLHALHRVEAMFGRTRSLHWGPRTLDLDLLLYGDEIIDQPDLVIPHPAMWYRRFVLDPAVHVAAEMRHPILNCSICDLHNALHARPLRIVLDDASLGVPDNAPQQLPALATPIDVCRLIASLNADSPELQWLSGTETGPDLATCFARVVLQHPGQETTFRAQPRNAMDRSINVFAASFEQAFSQLSQMTSAIAG